jgi:hypothetical protein
MVPRILVKDESSGRGMGVAYSAKCQGKVKNANICEKFHILRKSR